MRLGILWLSVFEQRKHHQLKRGCLPMSSSRAFTRGGTVPVISANAEYLTASLKLSAQQRKKDWWETYLKHVIKFYGVPMADIRKCVKAWVDLKRDRSTLEKKQTAWSLLEQPVAEQKLAGILILNTMSNQP